MLQIVTNIVVLNTLIAIIADSFEKVQNEKISYDALQKVTLLEELNELYMTFGEPDDEFVNLHVIQYAEQNQEETHEWEGKMKKMSKNFKDGIAQIQNEI